MTMNRHGKTTLAASLLLLASAAGAQSTTRPPDLFSNISDTYLIGLLLAGGFLLLIAEIKVAAYGLLGLGGLLSLSGAVLVLLRRPDAFFGIPPALLIAIIIAGAVLCVSMAVMGARAQKIEPASGYESFAGQLAEVRHRLAPEGKVFFQGSYWDAICPQPVEAGSIVRIVSADRLRLLVEPVQSNGPATPGV